ncbi:MAG TPA: type I 3-dehydroquinate dehydratase, partial [Phycisphaerae bacterium]
MTLLIASVAAEDLATLRKRALAALSAGADVAELRLDALTHLEPVAVRALCNELPPGGWIATCRPVRDGGAYSGDPEQRLALLASLAGIEAGIIDFEYREWRANPRARQMLSEALQSRLATPGAPGLIVSQHELGGRPADVHKLLAEIEAACPQAIAKLAWQSDDAADNLLALDAVRARPHRRIVVCMGAAGLAARVLAGKCGAYATYASAPDAAPTAPGQVSLPDMLDRYRFHLLDRETRVYGVVGDPVQQSVGPAGFNSVFARAAMDAIYLPLLLGPDESAFGRFVEGCLAREWLGFAGASVTHPHKIHALRLAGARIDATARRIGAVNTLVVRDSELWGYNTDYVGAHATFTDVLGVETRAIRAHVLGAGG